MKHKLLYSSTLLLTALGLQAQTQIGGNIFGSNANDQSGVSVALSADGSIVAMGAHMCSPFNDHIDPPANVHWAGQGRIFQFRSGSWQQIGQDIVGSDVDDLLGRSSSISADGSVVAFGAFGHDGLFVNAGQVRIFKNISGVWVQIGQGIDGKGQEELSGTCISLSNDGSIIAISAHNSSLYKTSSGQVRIYQNIGGDWTQIGNDIGGLGSGNNAYDYFGTSVSLSADGSIVAIGAPQKNSGATSPGKVKVYQNILGVWTQIGNTMLGQTDSTEFGSTVSLSDDGSTVVIGARGGNHAEVYKYNGGNWTKTGNDITGNTYSTSISADGSIVALGSPSNGTTSIFKYKDGDWSPLGNISGSGQSGTGISISPDGSKIVIGAPYNSDSASMSGETAVYDLTALLSSDQFVMERTSIYPNPAKNELFIKLNSDLNLQQVNIYSTLGQLIRTEKSNQINVSSLSKGFYLVQVVTDKGKATQKVLVD